MKYTLQHIAAEVKKLEEALGFSFDLKISFTDRASGSYGRKNRRLSVASNLKKSALLFVIAHEIGHAFRFDFIEGEFSSEEEEQFADYIATLLYERMGRNLPCAFSGEFHRKVRKPSEKVRTLTDNAIGYFL